MRFILEDVKAEGSLEKDEVFSPLDLLGEGPDNVTFNEPVKARAKAQYTRDAIYVSGGVSTTLTFVCSRCLENFEKSFSGNFSQIFNFDLPEISIDDEIRETVLIDLPIKTLCQEKCQGLCPGCGVNKNHHNCACETGPKGKLDAALKGIKIKKSQ